MADSGTPDGAADDGIERFDDADSIPIELVVRAEHAHGGPVQALAVIPGPDGTPTGFISGGTDGYLRTWTPDLQPSARTPERAHSGAVLSVKVIAGPEGTPTGYVSGGQDGFLRTWTPNLQHGTTTPAHDGAVYSVAVITGADGTPTGFISGGSDGYLRTWTPNLTPQATTRDPAHNGGVYSVAVMTGPDGTPTGFISGGDDEHLRTWTPDLEPLAATPERAHDRAVWSVAVMTGPDGTPTGFISGGTDGYLRTWTPNLQPTATTTERAHDGAVWSVAVMTGPDGTPTGFISGGGDGLLRTWTLDLESLGATPDRAHNGWVTSVAVIPDPDGTPTRFISGGSDGYLRTWTPNLEPLAATPERAHNGSVTSVAVIPDPEGTPTGFISGGDDGYLRTWTPNLEPLAATPERAHNGSVTSVAVIPGADGTPTGFLTGGSDGCLRTWTPNLQHATAAPAHDGWVTSVAVITGADGTPTGYVSGGQDGRLRTWTPNLQPTATTPQPARDGWVNSIAVITGPDGTPTGFISGGDDGYLRTWTPNLQPTATTPQGAHDGRVWSVAVIAGPDGTPTGFISGGNDGYLRIWTADLQPTASTPQGAHGGAVLSVAVIAGLDGTPTGFISGGNDGFLRTWTPDLQPTATTPQPAHNGRVLSVAVIPGTDGTPTGYVSGGTDGSIATWRLADHTDSRPRDPAPVKSAIGTRVTVDEFGSADQLERAELVGHLRGVIEQVALAHDGKSADPSNSAEGSQSTVIAISGRWGSGKTSLARLLVEDLGRDQEGAEPAAQILQDPVVVEFDAWRNREVGPEWWALGAGIYRDLLAQRARPTRWAMALVSAVHRVFRSTALVAGAVAVAVLLGMGAGVFDSVTRIAAAVAGVGVTIAIITRLLFWSSPALGALNQKAEDAPASEIAEIMSRLRRWSPRQAVNHRLADSTAAITVAAVAITALLWHFGPAAPQRPLWFITAAAAVVAAIGTVILVLTRPRPTPARISGEPGATAPALIAVALGVAALGGFGGLTRSDWWTGRVKPISEANDVPWLAVFALAACVAVPYLTWLGTRVAHPRRVVLLIIDELDRCDAEKTVNYLQAIHTLLRHHTPPKTFKRWRKPAPLIILLLADDRWVRQAFTSQFDSFTTLGESGVRDLGSDFLQKLIDHTVLVPQLSADQVAQYAQFVTDSPGVETTLAPIDPLHGDPDGGADLLAEANQRLDALSTAGEAAPGVQDVPMEMVEPMLDLASDRRRGGLSGDPRTVPSRLVSDLAARRSGAEGARARERDLLNEHAHVLPANPRLIRRCANTVTMLDSLTRSLGLRLSEDHISRAGIFFVRFPNLVDQLLTDPTAPGPDPTTWLRPDVAEVLRLSSDRRMSLQELARCYGKEFWSVDEPAP